MKKLIFSWILLFVFACQEKQSTTEIVQEADYTLYLENSNHNSYEIAWKEKEFWSKRLNADSTGIGELGNLAVAYESLFEQSGKIDHLIEAQNLYQKGLKRAAPQFLETFQRGLAHNFITQHRFKEADSILKECLVGVSNKNAVKMMLFDTSMELGMYDDAYKYLTDIKDLSDINYLIRLSKWSDHRGDLVSAIKYMEQAREKADASSNKALQTWTYSNLGDYYGHAGRIADSYKMYLKTLKFQPDNWYVLKGIAWMSYATEKNTDKAHKIINSLLENNPKPEYYLFQAELFEFDGYTAKAEQAYNQFLSTIENPSYGSMYNTYKIELLANKNPKDALLLALKEVVRRATPETYQLLAYAQLRVGDVVAALETVENHVVGKTYEPMAQYYTGLVYRANGKTKEANSLKEELLAASYEIGPLLTAEVTNW